MINYDLLLFGRNLIKNQARIITEMIAIAPKTMGILTEPVWTGIGVGVGVPVGISSASSVMIGTGVSVKLSCSMIGKFMITVTVVVD